MNYSDAVARTVTQLETQTTPNNNVLAAAIQLALHAAKATNACAAGDPDWAMFLAGLNSASDAAQLDDFSEAMQIDEQTFADTEAVRRQTHRLVVAVADRLRVDSNHADIPAEQGWRWASAAAELDTAAVFLAARQ